MVLEPTELIAGGFEISTDWEEQFQERIRIVGVTNKARRKSRHEREKEKVMQREMAVSAAGEHRPDPGPHAPIGLMDDTLLALVVLLQPTITTCRATGICFQRPILPESVMRHATAANVSLLPSHSSSSNLPSATTCPSPVVDMGLNYLRS